MPALPQSNSLQEIQRAFLDVHSEILRLAGGASTPAAKLTLGGIVKKGAAYKTPESTTSPAPVETKGRVYASVVTESIGYLETTTAELELTESADIISIETSVPAWVRVYNSAQSRSEDAGRPFRTDPVPGTGLMVEVLTFEPEDLLIYLSPVPFWNNCDEILGKTAYLSVTSYHAGAPTSIKVDFEILPQEQLSSGGPQGRPGETGPSGNSFTWKGVWDEDADYMQRDVVRRLTAVYVAVADNQGVAPESNPDTWDVMAEDGDPGANGTNGTNGTNGIDGADGISFVWEGTYSSGTTYAKDAVVESGGSSYISLQDGNTGHTPGSSPTWWELMAQKGADGSSSSGYPPDYISGLLPTWVSATSISVTPGAAYIESAASVLTASSTITKSSLSLSANTWYHLYLYSNAGTPDVEISTTGPNSTAFAGTARSKNSDTAKRYLGSIRTDASGNVLPFEAILRGNSLELNPGLRLVNGATDEQTVVSIDASSALFSEAVDYLLISFVLQCQAAFVSVKVHTDNGITTRAQCNHQDVIGLSGYLAYADYIFPRPLKRVPGSTTLYWWRRTWSGSTGGALYIDVHAFGLLR